MKGNETGSARLHTSTSPSLPPNTPPLPPDTSLSLFPLKDSLFPKKKSLFFTFHSRVQIPPRLLPSVTPAVLVTGTDDPNGFSETSASSPLIPGAGTGARSCRTALPKSRWMPDLKTMDIDAQLRLCRFFARHRNKGHGNVKILNLKSKRTSISCHMACKGCFRGGEINMISGEYLCLKKTACAYKCKITLRISERS